MKLQVGDRVAFLNETGGGVVSKVIDAHKVMVETEDGFEYEYPCTELIVVPDEEEQHKAYGMDEDPLAFLDKDQKKIFTADFEEEWRSNKPQQRDRKVYEVDLHIEELVDSKRGLTNTDIVQIQLAHFERKLEEAIKKKRPKIVFIHGVGQGVLKNEIRSILNRYSNLEYYDASYQRYGYGATEVKLWYR